MSVRFERWTLTKEALDTFLARFDSDRERAGESYEQVRRKLVTFFRCNGCGDAEGLVDETIDRTIRRLGEMDVHNLTAFIQGVARHVAAETHRARVREVPLDNAAELSQPRNDAIEEQVLNEKRFRCIEECSKTLNERDRNLLFEYYRFDKSQKIENKRKLAEAMGISSAVLRVRAFRLRQRLEECATNCVRAGSGS